MSELLERESYFRYRLDLYGITVQNDIEICDSSDSVIKG